MMTLKLLEIRDRGTFIPAFAFRAITGTATYDRLARDPQFECERYLLARAGYGRHNDSDCIVLGRLGGGECQYDPYSWPGGARTMTVAHDYIEKNWNLIHSGDVIDVEFILGETKTQKDSERLDAQIGL